jgi:Domain of unknown function (DUF4105)
MPHLASLALLCTLAAAPDVPAGPQGGRSLDAPAASLKDGSTEGVPADVGALVARARTLKLGDDPGWLRLGHYRHGLFGWKSEADGPPFYLAKNGQRDPAAELEATLAALVDPRPVAAGVEPVACRFPARRLYLKGRLGLTDAEIPLPSCPRFEAFRDRVAPVGATLVFSSYYLNNPASSFGHTLLRLDKSERREGERSELLDYGVSYAANATTSNPLAYAILGLFGGFRGEFTHFAYYYKVREYSDAESRDLWEYDLDLRPEELALLVAHLWELAETWFDYWYLDENCAYEIMTMLEAAAPRLNLLDHFGRFVVLPADTVKALFANPGLVRAVHYRPSILTQFRARIAPLSSGARDLVLALSADPATPIPDALASERAGVLDAALDHLDLWHFKDLVLERDAVAAHRRQVLLERRASLGIPSAPLAIPTPELRAPERGHGSTRVGVGGGASEAQGPLGTLELRLALHDLLDPPAGYPEVAHIEFLPVKVRVAGQGRLVRLDEAWALKIVSLNDLSRFDLRPSWRFQIGAETIHDAGGDGKLAFAASAGVGGASMGLFDHLDLFLGTDLDVQAAPALRGLDGSGWRLGAGPSALLRLRPVPRVVFLGEAGWRYYPAATPGKGFFLLAEGRVHLSEALSLAVRGRREPRESSALAVLYAYF